MRRVWTGAFYVGWSLYVIALIGLLFQIGHHRVMGGHIAVCAVCSLLGLLLSMGSLEVEFQALRRSWRNF